jgi:ribosomal protein S18 acetylase RimI-like enzyme
VEALGGWRLRATGGPTRRANSAWPGPDADGGGPDAAALAARIARVEAFYRERGLAPRVQIFPAAAPPGLDAELERRGWSAEGAVSVQVARAEVVAAAAPAPRPPGAEPRAPAPASFEAEVSDVPTTAWWSIAGERSRFAGAPREGYRALLERLAGRAGYALARAGGEPAATGLGVVDEGWLGVFSMLTLPAQRGRGAGLAVLAALARFARTRGAERLYLQVERGNEPAVALYARAGFRELYGYHYRTHPAGAGGRPRIALRHRLRPA